MKAIDKYRTVRSEIQTGDLILFKGHGIIPGIIQWADHAYYNHIGVADWKEDRLFVLEAWSSGVRITTMSQQMNHYDDFCAIRKINDDDPITLDSAINKLYMMIDNGVKYGYSGLIKRLLRLKLGISEPDFKEGDKPVCSDLAFLFESYRNTKCYQDIHLPSPQDFLRYADESMQILFDKR